MIGGVKGGRGEISLEEPEGCGRRALAKWGLSVSKAKFALLLLESEYSMVSEVSWFVVMRGGGGLNVVLTLGPLVKEFCRRGVVSGRPSPVGGILSLREGVPYLYSCSFCLAFSTVSPNGMVGDVKLRLVRNGVLKKQVFWAGIVRLSREKVPISLKRA